MPPTSTSTTSPGRSQTGGVCAKPQPDGVPYMITVPGASVMHRER